MFPKREQHCTAPMCRHWATVRIVARRGKITVRESQSCPGHASQVIRKLNSQHPGVGIRTEKIILPKGAVIKEEETA